MRKSQKLTLQELSNILNISPQVISRYELGEREADYETTHRIAQYFDVSVDYLLGFSDYFYPDKLGILQFTPEERKLVEDYQKLNSHSKKYLQDTMKMLLETSSGSAQNKRN